MSCVYIHRKTYGPIRRKPPLCPRVVDVCAAKYGGLARLAPSEILFFVQNLEPRQLLVGVYGGYTLCSTIAAMRTITTPSMSTNAENLGW